MTLLIVALAAQAADVTWVGTPDGTNPRPWGDPANWSPSAVPGPGDRAIVAWDGRRYEIDATGANVDEIVLDASHAGMLTGDYAVPRLDWKAGSVGGTVVVIQRLTVESVGIHELLGSIEAQSIATVTDAVLGGSDDGALTIDDGATFTATNARFRYASNNGGTTGAHVVAHGDFVVRGDTAFEDAWVLDLFGTLDLDESLLLSSGGNSDQTFEDGSRITGGGSVLVEADDAAQPAAVDLLGDLTLDADTTLEIGGNSVLWGPGVIHGGGTFAWSDGDIYPREGEPGTLEIEADTAFSLDGATLHTLDGIDLRVDGAAAWTDGGTILISACTWENAGDLAIDGGGLTTFNATGFVANSGSWTLQGGELEMQDAFENTGEVELVAGRMNFTHGLYAPYVQDDPGASTLLHAGTTLRSYEDGAETQLAPVEIDEGRLATAAEAGTATIDAPLLVDDADVVSEGTMKLAVTHDLGLTANSTVDLLLVAPDDFATIEVTGAATLDGTFVASIDGDPAFSDGVTFEVIPYASETGDFADVDLSALNPGAVSATLPTVFEITGGESPEDTDTTDTDDTGTADDTDDTDGSSVGGGTCQGCDSGRPAGGFGVALLALAVIRRRR